MRREHLDTWPHGSDGTNAHRIRQLLQEIWDAPEPDGENAYAPLLTQPWWELEQLVSQELELLVAEELPRK